jgi:hypothetical protein
MSQQIEKYKQSKILQRLLEALAPDFNKLQDKVNAVFEQGRRDGLSDMEIGDLVRTQMKEHYSQSTIQRVLPKSARHSEKVREQGNFAVKMTANEPVKMTSSEREPIDLSGKVSVQDTETGEHNFPAGMGVVITDDDIEEEQEQPIPSNDALIGRIDILQRENAQLRQENEQLRKENQELLQHNIEASDLLEKLQTKDNAPAVQDKDWLLGK